MQQIQLTYQQWMQVHPKYRSVIEKAPHVVAAGDDGALELMRVVFVRPECRRSSPRPGAGQTRLRGLSA